MLCAGREEPRRSLGVFRAQQGLCLDSSPSPKQARVPWSPVQPSADPSVWLGVGLWSTCSPLEEQDGLCMERESFCRLRRHLEQTGPSSPASSGLRQMEVAEDTELRVAACRSLEAVNKASVVHLEGRSIWERIRRALFSCCGKRLWVAGKLSGVQSSLPLLVVPHSWFCCQAARPPDLPKTSLETP